MTERSSQEVRTAQPPTALFVVAAGALVVCVVVLLWGAVATGISYDEPYHVLRLQNWFDHGWYLLADDLDGGTAGAWVDDTYVYASVAALLLHGLNVVAGNEEWGVGSMSAAAYAVRHLGIAAIGMCGVAATAGLGRILLGCWRWGVVCAGTLMAIPLWSGMSMINVKDTPVAVGYTVATLGLVMLLGAATRGRAWSATLLVTLGTVLAVGTRPGIWPGVAAGCGLVVLYLVVRERGRPRLTKLALVGVALLGALVALAAIYPAMFLHPSWLLDSVFSSANYRGRSTPRGATFVHALTAMPLLITLGIVVLGPMALRRRQLRTVPLDVRTVQGLLVVCQAFLLASLAFAQGSSLHGMRQIIFAVPALVVLLVWAFRTVHSGGRTGETGPLGRRILVGLAVVALVVPTLTQIRLFPYTYAYSSPAWDATGALSPRDYWRTSFRELAPSIPEGEFIVCSAQLTPDGSTHARYASDGGRSIVERSRDCRTDELSPFLPFRTFDVPLDEPVATTFLIAVADNTQTSDTCEVLASVTRQRHLRTQVMSTLRRCPLVLMPYPEEGARFSPEGDGSDLLMGGWTGNRSVPGVRMLERRADFGFALPDDLRGTPLRLSLDLDSDVAVDLSVNNTVVAVIEPGAGDREVDVPALGETGLDAIGLVVTLRAVRPGDVTMYAAQLTSTQGE